MDFAMSEAQREIREQILRLCSRFDDAYWLERDRTATFPEAFFAALAAGNWLGIAMPEAYRRRRARHHRSRDHDAGDRRVRRRRCPAPRRST